MFHSVATAELPNCEPGQARARLSIHRLAKRLLLRHALAEARFGELALQGLQFVAKITAKNLSCLAGQPGLADFSQATDPLEQHLPLKLVPEQSFDTPNRALSPMKLFVPGHQMV